MSKRFNSILYGFMCLTMMASAALFVPPITDSNIRSAQTEISLSEVEETRSLDIFSATFEKSITKQKGYFRLLRWHNHTINRQLRNVRSKWLTYSIPMDSFHFCVYPKEEAGKEVSRRLF